MRARDPSDDTGTPGSARRRAPRPPAPAAPRRSECCRPRPASPVPVRDRRLDEGGEERVGLPRPGAELGMELPGDEPRVIGQLDDLDELLLGPDARHAQTVLLEPLEVFVVDLVPV